jgi:ribosomal protein S18 acetylase RimI-like enzyme
LTDVSRGLLRGAALDDLQQVASWVATARECELWAGPRLPFPLDLSTLPSIIDFDETYTFALCDSDLLVAFGQLVPKASRRGHLARLIVAPEMRGRGFGETLVRALIDIGRQHGNVRASLNVDRANARAIALYLKVGFRDADRPADEPDSYGSRYMELRL